MNHNLEQSNTTTPLMLPLNFIRRSESEIAERANEFATLMWGRRTVRHFSPDSVPQQVVEAILKTAHSAPSGANKQPWRFIVVHDPQVKRQIRIAAEEEERESYQRRMPPEWLEDLAPLGTDWRKEFLEIAPVLIVVFAASYDWNGERKRKNYYVQESVGIACGMLIAAAHNAGLATLTHTPSPMNFLSDILQRPANERPYLLIPLGYPAPDAEVPDINRKPLESIVEWR